MYPRGRIAAVIAIVTCCAVAVSAQWPDVRTRVPLTASGAPNLEAPAPKLADGKTPDLSGVWDADKFPCNEATAALGCIDAPQGIPFGAINIAGQNSELPMQPWAAELFKQRRDAAGKDDTIAHCLPVSPARAWASFALQKIEWTNPHIYFYVDTKDNAGSPANWAVEMANPLALIRLGWTRNDMKVGDVVTVDGWLARDGSKLMNAKTVMLGGKKMFGGSTQGVTP